MTILKTERLTLRPPTVDDAPAFALTMGSYDVARWMTPLPWPFTLTMARDWLAQICVPHAKRAMFIVEYNGAMLGGVTIAPELGFGIARGHWGKGLGTEAVSAVLNWYFATSDHDTITCVAQHNNLASLRLQQKLGFLPTGRDARFSHALQTNVDHVVSTLTRSAWLGEDRVLAAANADGTERRVS